MKNGEVIQRVQSLYSKGTASDDTRLSSRHIYNKLVTVRGVVFRRRVGNNEILSDWNVHTIPCAELIKAPANECNINAGTKCDVMRTKYKVPATLSSKDNDLLSVSSIDGSVNYSQTTYEKSKYIIGGKYTANKQYFYIYNGYIYIINSRAKTISISAVFQDPIEAYKFEELYSGGNGCMDYRELDFETSTDMIDMIVDEASKELIFTFNKFGREDARNDARDTPLNEAK